MNAEAVELLLAHVKARLARWSLRKRVKMRDNVQKKKKDKICTDVKKHSLKKGAPSPPQKLSHASQLSLSNSGIPQDAKQDDDGDLQDVQQHDDGEQQDDDGKQEDVQQDNDGD